MSNEIEITHSNQCPENFHGIWIALLHARRIPPHIGLIFNNSYSSLNIKGKEIDIQTEILSKTILRQKTEVLFFKIMQHPVFSINYLHENFLLHLDKYEKVMGIESTCFGPIRDFFSENYHLEKNKMKFLPDLFPELFLNQFILSTHSVNLTENTFLLEKYDEVKLHIELQKLKY